MVNIENKINRELMLDTKIEDFCVKMLPPQKLKELESKRRPFLIIAVLALLINLASIISNFVIFAKRNEWSFNFNINDYILYTFIITIIIFFSVYNIYAGKIKNLVILILFKYIGEFKFGNKSQAKYIIKELNKHFPFYLSCNCTDRYIGKYRNTTVDIIKFSLSRFKFIPHFFDKCFDGLLIRCPYDRNYAINSKVLARRDEGIDDIKYTLNNGFICIIISAPRKIWFTFSLLFPATDRTIYNNILKEIVSLTKIINKFVPEDNEKK